MKIEINDSLIEEAIQACKLHSAVAPPQTPEEMSEWVNHLIYTETLRIKQLKY